MARYTNKYKVVRDGKYWSLEEQEKSKHKLRTFIELLVIVIVSAIAIVIIGSMIIHTLTSSPIVIPSSPPPCGSSVAGVLC